MRLRQLTTPMRQLRTRLYSSSFQRGPAPPKLPADLQAEFERLQRQAAVSSAFQPEAAEADAADAKADTKAPAQENSMDGALYKGAPPEFEGDTNPKTGEVGGPKNEPLRWGGQSDWSYNGKVTDF